MRADESCMHALDHTHIPPLSGAGTGETTWRCRILWVMMCSSVSIYFEGSIRGLTSRLGGGPVDLTASSIASGYNVAHCPVG